MEAIEKSLGIIGKGAIGTGSLCNCAVLEEANPGSFGTLFIFDPDHLPGIAFGHANEDNFLNTDPKKMGVLDSDPEGFVKFMAENETSLKKRYKNFKGRNDPSPSRKIFGEYLSQMSVQAIRKLESLGCKVVQVKEKVINVEDLGEMAIVSTATDRFVCTSVILAIGNPNRRKYASLEQKPGFCPSPWEIRDALVNVPQNSTIGIIGSGLAAIDAVLALDHYFPNVKIKLYSRSGSFPLIQTNTSEYHCKYFEPEELNRLRENGPIRLPDVIDLLNREIKYATDGEFDLESILSIKVDHENLLEIIGLTQSGRFSSFHSMMLAISPLLDEIWYDMAKADKERFRIESESAWMKIKHPFPLDTAIKLLTLVSTGRIQIISDVKEISWDEPAETFNIALGDGSIESMKYLVDASSEGLDFSQDPLVANIVDSNHALVNEFGGLTVRFQTGQLVTQNGLSNCIYCIGAIAKGTRFYVNAYTVNRSVGSRLADFLWQSRYKTNARKKRFVNRLIEKVTMIISLFHLLE